MKEHFLYKLDNERWLSYKRDGYYIGQDLIAAVKHSFPKSLLSHSRLISRFYRMEPRCIEKLDGKRFVVSHMQKVWLLDIDNKSLVVVKEPREGFSTPLNLCTDGESVYWGDYGNNASRETVNIYKFSPSGRVETVFAFPKGTIRHIHNIVWDKAHGRFFVLTGDLEDKSGIYTASADWKEVTPVVTGLQQYRAVVAFPYRDGLIYATDSVVEKNRIYLLRGGIVEPLSEFPGSCIYGTETRGYYVFASTVEPPEGRGLMQMLTYKLGAGIKDRYVHLITVRKSDLKDEECLKLKKDIWPMKLFQYGAAMFPKGQEESDDLWYYVMACKGDGHSYKMVLGN